MKEMQLLFCLFIIPLVLIEASVIKIPLKHRSYVRDASHTRLFRNGTAPILSMEKKVEFDGHIPLTNFLEFQFYGQVQLGTPSQTLEVCFDTGSSDFWVPSAECVDCSGITQFAPKASDSFEWIASVSNLQPSIKPTQNFTVQYGSGAAHGAIASDVVDLGGFSIDQAIFGVVTSEKAGMNHMRADGLLGLAFNGLSTFSHPPIFQQLLASNPQLKPIFSVYLSPVANSPGSELLLGGINSDKVKPNAEWLSHRVLPQFGLWTFWRVPMHSLRLDSKLEVCPTGCVAIVDTGTSLIGVPIDLYLTVLNGIAETTRERGCLCALTMYGYQCFLCSASAFPTIRIGLDDRHFFLLRGEDYVMCEGSTCLPLLQPAGQDMWILGDVFLKKYYSVFDMAKKQVSFSCVTQQPWADCGYEQTHDTVTEAVHLDQVNINTILVLFVSGLSMVGSAFIIGSFWHYPSLRQKRVLAMVYWLSISNFIYDLFVWVAGVARFPETSTWCLTQATLQQFFGLSTILFSAVISLELVRAVRGQQAETKDYSRVYHMIIWSICLVVTIFCMVFGVIGQVPDLDGPEVYCWSQNSPNWARVVFFYIPVTATMLFSIYAMNYSMRRLHETKLLQTALGRRSAKLLVSYVTVFILSYLLAVILGICSIFNLYFSPWLGYLNEICFYSQGILNCFVWAFSPSFHDAFHSRLAENEREVECLLQN